VKAFAYVNPANEKEAVAALKVDGIALPIAGGQDLLARMKDYIDSPDRLVNVKGLDATVTPTADGGVPPVTVTTPGMDASVCATAAPAPTTTTLGFSNDMTFSDPRGSRTATRTTRGVEAEPNDYSRLDSVPRRDVRVR